MCQFSAQYSDHNLVQVLETFRNGVFSSSKYKLAPKVVALIEEGRSYRWIARDLSISKNTVMDIVKRARDAA